MCLRAIATTTCATTISGGTLQIGNGGTAGTLGGGAVSNSGALVFNRTDNYGGAISTAISGTGSLTLSAGNLTLSGSNGYSGATVINAATLTLNGSLAAGSAVTVNSSGTLTGTGTVNGTSAIYGTVTPAGAGVIGTLNTNALTFYGGSTLAVRPGGGPAPATVRPARPTCWPTRAL